MAKLNRSKTLTNSANRQDLYDLISTAGLTGLVADDISDLSLPVTAASSPPTLDGQSWWWDMTNQLFKMPIMTVGASPSSFWAAAGPDAWHFPGYNVVSYTLEKGTLVRWGVEATSGEWDITPMEPVTSMYTDGRTLRADGKARAMYGFLQEDLAPNSFGPVLTMGFGHAKVDWVSAHALYLNNNNGWLFPLIPSTQYTGMVQAPPRSGETQNTWVTFVATGMARPHAVTTASVLGPVWASFPAGRTTRNS